MITKKDSETNSLFPAMVAKGILIRSNAHAVAKTRTKGWAKNRIMTGSFTGLLPPNAKCRKG